MGRPRGMKAIDTSNRRAELIDLRDDLQAQADELDPGFVSTPFERARHRRAVELVTEVKAALLELDRAEARAVYRTPGDLGDAMQKIREHHRGEGQFRA